MSEDQKMNYQNMKNNQWRERQGERQAERQGEGERERERDRAKINNCMIVKL